MTEPRPVTEKDREDVKRLHGEGLSMRAIAKEIGRALSTTQTIAKDLGLAFDGRPTAAATEAKRQDNAARRADIAQRLYRRVEFNLERLEAEEYSYTDRVSSGIVTEILNHVPANEEKNLIAAIGSALASAAKLEATDAGSTPQEHAMSAIGQIGAALQAAAEALRDEDPDDV